MWILGFVLCYLAIVVAVFGAFGPAVTRLPLERRRPGVKEPETGLTRVTGATVESIDRVLGDRGWSQGFASALERAGIKLAPAEFVVLVASGAAIAALFAGLIAGPVLGFIALIAAPLVAKLLLGFREGKRKKAFADQLDDTLQLLAGGLRAGHSLLRAIDAVSRESESPTAEEFARVVNQTRLGRDLNDSLDETAARMGSEDFSWVAQAIGIHREVGGDLSSVLDEVGHTIRERNQIRRQVASLSAEGKMSAYVLVALPFVVVGVLVLTSPSYILRFVEGPIGFMLIALSAVMLTIGSLWMRKVVSFKF
ncbi:tight adherence protein B [Glaciihabitans tibetensis]|uniref:Tight adherence protein B n=1 Tax=Glaciihabitans tibetensis TaxID=1266600 RepID=A0A2T0VBD3_9MICO|nr:type II secretion system F family protein [Glaciihabitans tibetensis]PRY67509.1 tight adherence protein B [Glaciihabitans tibetensis]